MVLVKDIIENLLLLSEKSAGIARICRQDENLLRLLIEEKDDETKNKRFFKDFKTLADVLIQELIKHCVGKQFPSLQNSIYGEESNTFTNSLGDSVIISLNDCIKDTELLLAKVLNGDKTSARILASQIHSEITLGDVPIDLLPSSDSDIDVSQLAIWIDPIDSTAEYINGISNNYDNVSSSVSLNGLNCVTIIIGIFNKLTGVPVIGVINQPFFTYVKDRWCGRCFWGFSLYNSRSSSILSSCVDKPASIIAVSSCENKIIRKKLSDAGFTLISPAGAGYKILCLILGKIDAYLVSQKTTYFWDTCGGHAVLSSLGGNIWNYEEVLKDNFESISYKEKDNFNKMENYLNKWGFIACKDNEVMKKIVEVLR